METLRSNTDPDEEIESPAKEIPEANKTEEKDSDEYMHVPENVMPLEEIAEFLKQNESEYINLYNKKHEEWKSRSDALILQATQKTDDLLAETGILQSNKDSPDLIKNAEESLKILYGLLNTPDIQQETKTKLYASAIKMSQNLPNMAEKLHSLHPRLEELIKLLRIRGDVAWYYSEKIKEVNMLQSSMLHDIVEKGDQITEILSKAKELTYRANESPPSRKLGETAK